MNYNQANLNSAPYADEWAALRAQRQREYEIMVTLMRWGDLMDVTKEIAKECHIPTTPVQPKAESGFSMAYQPTYQPSYQPKYETSYEPSYQPLYHHSAFTKGRF